MCVCGVEGGVVWGQGGGMNSEAVREGIKVGELL